MNATRHDRMIERIAKHGLQLLAIFTEAPEQDPVALCKRLRRIEVAANRDAVAYSNGDIDSEQWDKLVERHAAKANKALATDRVWVNGDPRGYTLKIDLKPGEVLHQDWGGYGIIAPDLSESD